MHGSRTGYLFLALCLVASCAEERPPINRIQANALKKSFFVGADLKRIDDDPEFYMRGTVIDVGYGAAQDGLFTSTYAQPVSRVRWEITESYLNARLAYERIPGTDTKGVKLDGLRKKTSNDGQIVASYRISSHFDVKRSYNPTTGEALNIVEENSTDRPWYEREYFRVDWSKNEATETYDFDTLSLMGIYGGIEYEPLAFYVEDPSDENAPRFDTEGGYFDVTTKAFAKPKTIDLSSLGWGVDKFPACMLPGSFAGGTEPYGNCNPVEITIRQSFRKVVDTDYEPVDHDGVRFQAFGAFNFSYRKGYEQNYGMVDDRWYRFAARYNVWERSHYYEDAQKMTGEVPCATKQTTVTATGKATADPNRDDNHDGTADECDAVTRAVGRGGSQCDVFKNRCTLPLALRKPLTIPWYINGNTDEDLFEATNWAVQEWNVGMMSAIQTSRLVECRRTKGATCDKSYPMWTGQQDDYDDAVVLYRELEACRRSKGWDSAECPTQLDDLAAKLGAERGSANDRDALAIAAVLKQPPVIVLCHNPVVAGDHAACGKQGLAPRLGDLRYNTVLNIPKPQSPSAWGIMVDADDPVTGEKVAASINIWTHITDIAAQQLVDLVRYMNGELKTEEVTNGKNVDDWVQASKLQGGLGTTTLSKDEVQQRLAAAAHLGAADYTLQVSKGVSPEALKVIGAAEQQILDVATHADAPSRSQIEASARMNLVRGTPTEAKLINPAMLQLAGVSAGTMGAASSLQAAASPLGLNHPKIRAQLRQMRENGLARRGACILEEAPEASALTGIADIMKKKFPVLGKETDAQRKARWDGMFRYIRRRYQYAIIAHEMGHSIGLRHNFVSSFGALHYRPQYWQLRTKNGAVTTPCTDAVADGASCVGPRYFDPVTADEQSQLIWMFSQSSAMDYAGDVSQDMIGLGIWDFGAARLFYGDTVAVYADQDLKAGTPAGVGLTNATDTFGGLAGIKYMKPRGLGLPPETFHYSQLQNEWKLLSKCYPVTAKQPSWWKNDKDGAWDPLLDGHIVTVDGKATKCRQRPVDYVAWNDLRQPTAAEIGGGVYRGGPSVDATGRLRVPYHFATDHWADLGNLSVFRHDAGADPYEQAMFLITTQENRHIFDNFRRDRTTFNVRGAADRSFSRYNEKLVGIAGGIAFFTTIYQNHLLSSGFSFNQIWPIVVDMQVRDQMIAASVVFDHFTRQLARPEDGPHYFKNPSYADPVLRSANDADGIAGATSIVIPNGTTGYLRDVGFGGHPVENALADDKGDFDVEYTVNAGSYYDKINSIIHMSLSEDRFISQSRQDFYDARFRANGMADIFPDGYRRVIANALTGDRAVMASYAAADAAGKPLLNTNIDPLDPQSSQYPARPLGWTSWWSARGPAVCFASSGRNVCSYEQGTANFNPDAPARALPVDPQIGWEVQKFVIAWVLAYIPANEQSKWLDMLKLYRLGPESAPQFEQRIEWEDPVSGQVYYARTYGTECLFGTGSACTGGKIVQKGIAARMLEYASSLVSKGYKLDTTACPATASFPAGFTTYGRACLVHQPDGTPVVISDPAIGNAFGLPLLTCDRNVVPDCIPLTTTDNHYAYELTKYKSVPDYLWESLIAFGHAQPKELGVYP